MRSLRSLAAKAFFWLGRVNFAQSPAAIYLGPSRRNWAQADQRVAAPPCPPQPLAKADFPLQIFKEPAPERRTNSIIARLAGNASCKMRKRVSRCFRWNKTSLPHCLKVPSANPEGILKGVESIGFSDILAPCHNRWQRFCGRDPPSRGSYGEPSDRAPKEVANDWGFDSMERITH